VAKNMTKEKQNQTQENCPLCEVSPETIERLKKQSEIKEEKDKKAQKNNFWQKLFKRT
jgi:hypothetical protein